MAQPGRPLCEEGRRHPLSPRVLQLAQLSWLLQGCSPRDLGHALPGRTLLMGTASALHSLAATTQISLGRLVACRGVMLVSGSLCWGQILVVAVTWPLLALSGQGQQCPASLSPNAGWAHRGPPWPLLGPLVCGSTVSTFSQLGPPPGATPVPEEAVSRER